MLVDRRRRYGEIQAPVFELNPKPTQSSSPVLFVLFTLARPATRKPGRTLPSAGAPTGLIRSGAPSSHLDTRTTRVSVSRRLRHAPSARQMPGGSNGRPEPRVKRPGLTGPDLDTDWFCFNPTTGVIWWPGRGNRKSIRSNIFNYTPGDSHTHTHTNAALIETLMCWEYVPAQGPTAAS